jgi:hypothetical protein
MSVIARAAFCRLRVKRNPRREWRLITISRLALEFT